MLRVRKFAALGIALGSVFAGWAVVLAALGGSWNLRLRSGDEMNVVLVVLVYLVGGCVGGGVVGVLLPMVRWRVGAVAVGILAVLPFTYGVAVSVAAGSGGQINLLALAITAGLLGGVGGLAYREIFFEGASD